MRVGDSCMWARTSPHELAHVLAHELVPSSVPS